MQVSHTCTYSLSCVWLHFKKLSLLLGSHLLAGLHAQHCSSSAGGCGAPSALVRSHLRSSWSSWGMKQERSHGCIIKQLLLQSEVGPDQSQAIVGELAVCVEGEEAVKWLLCSVLFCTIHSSVTIPLGQLVFSDESDTGRKAECYRRRV